MTQKIVAANWKMNKTYQEGLELASEVINMMNDEVRGDVTAVLCTPFIHLQAVSKLVGNAANVQVGAQNCSTEKSGAYTGETSVDMIKSTGAAYVIIGHSERREYFKESAEQLAKKVDQALEAGLTPIFCCGETRNVRENEDYLTYVCKQLTDALYHLSAEEFSKVVIAYEPVWAIGTGLVATPDQAQEMHAMLRTHLGAKFGDVAKKTSILYGGSVNAGNAAELFGCADVDGGLVGGASLKSRDFVNIVKALIWKN